MSECAAVGGPGCHSEKYRREAEMWNECAFAFQLTDEERVYLQAAGIGDVGVIRQSLEEVDNSHFNVNCVDYMGRNALHLAVDSENMDCIELLCDKLSFECIEEALLHAISKGLTKIVRTIIEHPNYMAGEDKIKRMDYNNAFFRTEEKSQFSPDITPLILSAHYNNHEIIQMFLARNHTIEKPHVITCLCEDCQIKQNYDSLKRSRSRLNAYRALASPAYMALSSPDPIMTTFELRQEMMKLAEVEKEFKVSRFDSVSDQIHLVVGCREMMTIRKSMCMSAYPRKIGRTACQESVEWTEFRRRHCARESAALQIRLTGDDDKSFRNNYAFLRRVFFQTEYLTLVEQCMNFACEMMDLCRGTQEVEAVISDNLETEVCGANVRDPLGRLRMAIRYQEKKFVAHANCQQYLTSIWYGSETAFLQSWTLAKKVGLSLIAAPLLPLICIVYIILPTSKVSKGLRCPAAKFATHTVSHFLFLVLLAAATFRVDDTSVTHAPVANEMARERFNNTIEERKTFLKKMLRPESTVITPVQILIILWTAGHLVSEIKQVYFQGIKEVVLNAYSMLNFFILSLYIASYTIRIIVDLKIKEANNCYNATQLAAEFLTNVTYSNVTRIKDLEVKFNQFMQMMKLNETCRRYMYFLEASRFNWVAHDPEIVSDVLFAVANVLSFARTIFLMPAFEVLGPLQISFSRMLTDIARFLVLFALVLLAFMVGMHNLYWYYGLQRIARIVEVGNQTFTVEEPATEPFEGLVHTLFTLFWAMFNNFQLASLPIKHPYDASNPNDAQYQYKDGMIKTNSSTEVVETVGMTLMAFYHVIIIIVLINMLIAMMSHSFEDIQSECDVEWKFARTKLWLNYIDNGSTLPVPCNLLPTPQSVARGYKFMRRFFSHKSVFASSENSRSTAFI
uniref:ANK_REP_REGION domain-containing protein n=2 Tax=Macrostomum lignano TaxID=282301 RepID=A0A1I8HH10_9PLAT